MSDRYPDATLDIFSVPPPPVLQVIDYESTLATVVAGFVANLAAKGVVYDVQKSELDPAMALLQEAVYREMYDDAAINDAAKAVMLGYSFKGNQDWLYALLGIRRLTVRAADATASPPVTAIMEDDEAFRFRAQIAGEGQAPGLTGGGYAHVALRASPEVKRVSLVRVGGGRVDVILQGRSIAQGGTRDDGGVSDAARKAVWTALNDDWSDDPSTGSQMTDIVQVFSAEPVSYPVKVRAIVPRGPSLSIVKAASLLGVVKAAGALQITGAEVATDAMIAAARLPAMTKLWLDAPARDLVCTPYQVPNFTGATVDLAVEGSAQAGAWLKAG